MQSTYNYFFLTKLSKVISFYEIALHKSQYRLEPESHPRALPDQNIEWHHQVTTTTKFESEGLYWRCYMMASAELCSPVWRGCVRKKWQTSDIFAWHIKIHDRHISLLRCYNILFCVKHQHQLTGPSTLLKCQVTAQILVVQKVL